MKAPCKDCPDRKLLCHSMCPKYQEFKVAMEEEAKYRAAERDKFKPMSNEIKSLVRARSKMAR